MTYLFFDYDLLHINSTTAKKQHVQFMYVLAAYSAARKLQSGVVLLNR